ncbi:MAG TPA: glycosyltransferase family 4 protein [Candidatus Methylacidiphilales bacterium]|nr:glycosyltransferase family 4 protein [Candidatus Methylacidiphilales bacterium]
MDILIEAQSDLGDAFLDPDYCEKHPLGGSETALIKMAQALRKLGAQVTLVTRPTAPSSSPPDVFVSLRRWQIFDTPTPLGKLNYLWCQDDADQPLVTGLKDRAVAARIWDKCDGVMMLSHYQAARWKDAFGLPANKIFLTSNGIDVARFRTDPSQLKRRAPWAYYASTPFRGLAQLLDFWPTIYKATGARARLFVCSSLQVYGVPEEPKYELIYQRARALEGVEYLGSVNQERLREVAATCRALAYPCIFPETSCIAAMEAMASGCVVVGTSLGALPETAWRNPLVLLDESCAEVWIENLLRVLTNDAYYEMLAFDNLRLAQLMDWTGVARRWLMRFQFDSIKRAWRDKASQGATVSP